VEGHRKRSTASYGRRDVSLIQVKPYLGKSPQATVVTSQMLPEVNHRLSPPYKSPQIDMGYDIFDFEDIHVLCDTLSICLLRPRRFTLRAARFPSWRDCCTKSVVRQSPPLPPYCNPEPNPSHYIGGSSQEVPRREVAKERKDARRGGKTTVAGRSKYNSYLVCSGRGCGI
jgi:hypothetical protein